MAVVEVDALSEGELHGGWAERSCTTVPDDGGTVFVHDPSVQPALPEGHARLTRVTRASLVRAARDAMAAP